MSIKGFPTTQKLINNQSSRNDFATLQPQDVALRQAIDVVGRFAFRVDDDTTPRTAGANTGNPSAQGGTVVYDTSTPARVGDFVRFETGNAARLEIPIVDVASNGNSFVLGARLPTAYAPASGDTFFVMRYATQLVDENGAQQVSVSSGPIAYVLNGTDTDVSQDTGTPSNSKPLPVRVLNPNGTEVTPATSAKQDSIISEIQSIGGSVNTDGTAVGLDGLLIGGSDGTNFQSVHVDTAGDLQVDVLTLPSIPAGNNNIGDVDVATLPIAFNSGTTNATTQRVVLATDVALPAGTNNIGDVDVLTLPSIPAGNNNIGDVDVASMPVNTNGQVDNTSLSGTTATTATAPANAVGFVLAAASSNTNDIRYRVGGTASTTAGMLMEPGRDTGYIPCKANISICATASGTNAFSVFWILSS